MKDRSGARRHPLRASVAAGVVVAVLLAAAGAAYAFFLQPRGWVAESMIVVLPSAKLDQATSASYYETLSRGQIVATFAEVAGSLRFEEQAEDQLGLSAAQRAAVSTEVTVVPDTAVILIRSTAPEAAVARDMSRVTTELSVAYLAELSRPFRAVTVPTGRGTAEPTGTSPLVLLGAAVVAGLVAGLAVQQAVYHLAAAARRPAADPAPDPDPAPADPNATPADATEEDVAARRGVPAEV